MISDPEQQSKDVALLIAISAGDEKAFTKLYTCYQPKLLKFCAGYLKGDVSLAADVVDDALFDVWNKASNYKEVAKVSTWIFTIARYKTIDFLRKKREVTLTNDEELVLEESSDVSPEKLKNQADEQARVKSC